MEWRSDGAVRWLEAGMPGARAIFSARTGGVSEGDFESLNLGLLTDDDSRSVAANRDGFNRAVGIDPGAVLSGRQVHGADVLGHDRALVPSPWIKGSAGAPADVDGHATASAGLAPLVYVADCLPVALAGSRGVAMLHCGWRGLAAGIIARGVEAVGGEAAAIGPGIGPCCYEVGAEVLSAFEHLGTGVAAGRMLDLAAVAEALLREQGIERIQRAGLCTSCRDDLFFSHRRDRGRTGRQVGLVVACRS